MKTPKFLCLLIVGLLLVSCQQPTATPSNQTKNTNHETVAIDIESKSENSASDLFTKIKQPIIEQKADELLADSTYIQYPENIDDFDLKLFTDNGYIIAEVLSNDKVQLFAFNKDNPTGIIITEPIATSDRIVHYIVHASRDHYLLYEEADDSNRISKYYLYDFNTHENKLIHTIADIGQLHFTDLSWNKDDLYLNCYEPSYGNYVIHHFNLVDGSHEVVVETQSNTPIVKDDYLYYIAIDNDNLVTQVVKLNLFTKESEILKSTTGQQQFIAGIYSNGTNFLLLTKTNDLEKKTDFSTLSLVNDNFEIVDVIVEMDRLETVKFKGNYITFVGDHRPENEFTPFYLIDLANRINYIYYDSSIFVSKMGILWTQFLVNQKDIAKGSINTNQNSVMRLYEFK